MPAELVIALVASVGYLSLAPSVVNGDGLGYLAAAVHGDLYPGHLAYVPLLELLRRLAHVGPRPVDALWVARVLSALSAGVAVLAVGRAARRLFADDERRHAATIAALGLAGSFAVVDAGSDVETYAPALAALCLATWALAARRDGAGPTSVTAAGLALAAATLLHVENALFGLCALFALPRRDWPRLVVVSVGVTLPAYLVAGAHPAWLLGASHGFAHPLGWSTPKVALYGACKALVYLPHPFRPSLSLYLGHVIPGAIAVGLLAALAASSTPPFGRAVTIGWTLPYLLVGVVFFPSDPERWIFLLPLFWLAVASTQQRARVALACAVLLGALNGIAWARHATDGSWRDHAARAVLHVEPGDLVVSPGHGWDEYLGFYDPTPLGHYPLAFHAGRLGSARALAADLAEAIRDARRRHHHIELVRFDSDGDELGWKELAPFGVTPANVRALLPAGREVPLGDGVYRLDPP